MSEVPAPLRMERTAHGERLIVPKPGIGAQEMMAMVAIPVAVAFVVGLGALVAFTGSLRLLIDVRVIVVAGLTIVPGILAALRLVHRAILYQGVLTSVTVSPLGVGWSAGAVPWAEVLDVRVGPGNEGLCVLIMLHNGSNLQIGTGQKTSVLEWLAARLASERSAALGLKT